MERRVLDGLRATAHIANTGCVPEIGSGDVAVCLIGMQDRTHSKVAAIDLMVMVKSSNREQAIPAGKGTAGRREAPTRHSNPLLGEPNMATKKKVSGASKARREAARVRDAELSATAIAMLESSHIGERIAHLVTTPRLLTYSLRNQALLLGQADERGMTLTDVDTYRGWQRRGRHVRPGEHGLKIVRPVRRSESTADHTDGAGDQAEPDTDIKFRTITVFDRAQTDELEDPGFGEHNSDESHNGPAVRTDAEADEEADEEAAAMPEAVLLESLREQAERAGYLSVILPANHTGSVDVDHQGRTIIVYNDGDTQTLAQFASTVAAIIASQAKTKAQARVPTIP